MRRLTSLRFGVVAVVVALTVGAAGAAPIIVSTTQTEVTIGGLACGTQYRVRVNVAGDSRITTLKPVTKPCPLPPPAPPPPPPPGGEPAPIAGQGYIIAFQDQFDTFNTSIWTPHSFWETEVPGSVAVSNGTLKIDNKRSDGYPAAISVSSGPTWGGEQSHYDFKFGYAEARMRFTGGKGSWPAFWLSSSAHAEWPNWPQCPEPDLNFELDIMEYQGDEPNTFYGTTHRNTGGVCGLSDQTRGDWPNLGLNLSVDWHKYAVLWTANSIKWYVDEQLVIEKAPFDSSDQDMYILLTMQACGWDGTNDCDANTADVLRTEVDWVRVWQKP